MKKDEDNQYGDFTIIQEKSSTTFIIFILKKIIVLQKVMIMKII